MSFVYVCESEREKKSGKKVCVYENASAKGNVDEYWMMITVWNVIGVNILSKIKLESGDCERKRWCFVLIKN